MRPHPCLAPAAGVLALLLSAAGPLVAQVDPDAYGKTISNVPVEGAGRESTSTIRSLSGLRRGQRLTKERIDQAYKELWKTNRFEDVQITVRPDPDTPRQVLVVIRVKEYHFVSTVVLRGFDAIPDSQLKPNLRIQAGDHLNPFHLKQDLETLRNEYLQKGYHFSDVKYEIQTDTRGDVVLIWNVIEGPLVSVDRIIFSGIDSVDESDLRRYMLTKENGRLLGLVETGQEPFVERNLDEDIKRIKLFYKLEGWLDIDFGNRIFIRDLEFSDDKTRVTIRIHVDEGDRYQIRSVRFQFDPADKQIFSEEEMKGWLESKADQPYTENNANLDVATIRSRYGERAYILAEVTPVIVVAKTMNELDLIFRIKENQKIYVGRLIFEGNMKTREDVLRREFTRTGFIPGEEFNRRSMERAVRRIQDRGWVEPGGLLPRTRPGADPNTRDIVFNVKEGQTGNIRFAAGFSSSFGILGILEFTQRNFDIADIPKSFGDFVGGNGFAGGGQFFRIRLAPAARRQSYTIDFKEPYVFGHEVGLGLRAYSITTVRESYDDSRLGATIQLDKRWDPFAVQMGFNGYKISVEEVESDAPPLVRDLAGDNVVFMLSPALIYDTRDSFIFPTEGFRFLGGVDYAGQVLGGDFDFNRLRVDMEGHVTLHETESGLKHVGSVKATFGWVHAARGRSDVPLVERFYAGGRGSIRGFEFRGMGPHVGRDPVGGEASALVTLEYSYPVFVEFLRGAFFYDIANLTSRIEDLPHDGWRHTVGFGIRFLIPQLGNIPVKLDFGFPIQKESGDERQTVTFDIGALF